MVYGSGSHLEQGLTMFNMNCDLMGIIIIHNKIAHMHF